MARNILFIPYDTETGQCGDWYELQPTNRRNFREWYSIVRYGYPKASGYDILITTTEDKVPMMEVRPYVGTFFVEMPS